MGKLDIVIFGLSITSSWGNGHATTYRGLVRELAKRGHKVTFLERDVPWYAERRDLPRPPYGRTFLYRSFDELRATPLPSWYAAMRNICRRSLFRFTTSISLSPAGRR